MKDLITVTTIDNNVVNDIFETAMGEFWDAVNMELFEKYDMSSNLRDKYIDKIDFELKTSYNNDII